MLFSTPVQNIKLTMDALPRFGVQSSLNKVNLVRRKKFRAPYCRFHRFLSMQIRIALIGLGRTARQSHIPALKRTSKFQLVAAVDPATNEDLNVPLFTDCGQLLDSLGDQLDAVAICTPPQLHTALAIQCANAGLHVLLEKPPATNLGEAQALLDLAGQHAGSIYFTWHSRMNAGVDQARDFLENGSTWRFEAVWREDPRDWHGGQQWIWQPGGLGVFDAGINALSILTALSRSPWYVAKAELGYQEPQQTPVAAILQLRSRRGDIGTLVMDWRAKSRERRDIRMLSPKGFLELSDGGSSLHGALQYRADKEKEYDRVYEKFHQLILEHRSEMDLEPLRIVADAFLIGSRLPISKLNLQR
jgi:D-galactose 1-dehydrogenase